LTHRGRAFSQASPSPALSRLLTVRELADLLQVPPKTIYAWRYKGMGPTAVPVGKYLRFRPEDVAAWLDARTQSDSGEARELIVRGGGRMLRTERPRRRVPSAPANSPRTDPGKSSSS
jgi:excisionase family DNA binding protein